ncbi:MAG: hypothetical protein IJP43_02590 [Oscillospiraceae bacterium]|nr:hypothetical protein [Oscillospiraceae bacterium]
MKQYKVVKCGETEAERVMNDMACEGWEVKCVTYWQYWWYYLVVTFEREI